MKNKIKDITIDQTDKLTNNYRLAEILNEIIEAINRHEDLITNLRGGWTDVEIKTCAIDWKWPMKGNDVWLINSQGQPIYQRWTDSEKQNRKRDFLGVYRTKEEALDYLAMFDV